MWSITSDETDTISSYPISLNDSGILTICLAGIDEIPTNLGMLWLNVKGVLKHDTPWADKGHIVVEQQFDIVTSNVPEMKVEKTLLPEGRMKYHEEESSVVVSIDRVDVVVVDKTTGLLAQFNSPSGEKFIAQSNVPLGPNFTRASTDNDRGGAEFFFFMMFGNWVVKAYEAIFGLSGFSYHYHWSKIGLAGSDEPITECKEVTVSSTDTNDSRDSILIKAVCVTRSGDESGRMLFDSNITYEIFSDGQVKISYQISPTAFVKNLPSLPRIGMKTCIDSSFTKIVYVGRGPYENYPDRKTSSDMGRWSTNPTEMHVDYIVPSENGNRCDCRWISFENKSGSGFCIKADESVLNGLCFSAQLYETKELHTADHTYDLPERIIGKDPIHFNIDFEMMGIGGDLR